MRKQLDRPRLNISAWYIGAGSLISVFTARPSQPFSKLKSVYGNELIKHGHQLSKNGKIFTETDKIRLKKRIRKDIKKENIRMIIGLVISIFLLIVMIIAIMKLLRYFMQPQFLRGIN